MKGIDKLPRMRINTERVLGRAESKRDLVTMPSKVKGTGYVTDGEEVLIVTADGGYLRMAASLIPSIIYELQYLKEDIERRSRD